MDSTNALDRREREQVSDSDALYASEKVRRSYSSRTEDGLGGETFSLDTDKFLTRVDPRQSKWGVGGGHLKQARFLQGHSHPYSLLCSVARCT